MRIESTKDREGAGMLQSIVEAYSTHKGRTLTIEQKESLVEYLLPYTRLVPYTPTVTEIRMLATSLDEGRQAQIERILASSTPEIRKGLYFLFKVRDKIEGQKLLSLRVFVDSESTALKAAKNAAIGVYLSWFREIAEGKGSALRSQIEQGLFDICYMIYQTGQAYAYLTAQTAKEEESESTKAFYSVMREHLETYRNEIYNEESGDLFEFYIVNTKRMKWITRLCHLSQELFSLEGGGRNAGQLINLASELEGSPWTESFSREVLSAYKLPLTARVFSWIKGGGFSGSFIKEVPGRLWDQYVLVEEDVPTTMGVVSGKEVLYLGKSYRLLALLESESELSYLDAMKNRPFSVGVVHEMYLKTKGVLRREYFEKHQIFEHADLLRDIFFLFRDDFSNDLFRSLSTLRYNDEVPSMVDESLERCFGRRIDLFIDVVESNTSLILVYKPVLPYSIVTEGLVQALSEGFEYFWMLRQALRGADALCKAAEDRVAAFSVLSAMRRVEYHLFERLVKGLWNFRALPENCLYNPSRLSRYLEDTAQLLLRTCKEACPPAVLKSMTDMGALDAPETLQTLSGMISSLKCE
ncbi:hypothetical protein NEDG_00729 [Nematocida displodere]|uniref:Spindle pole body component n=1 Tax=Nematocida displodere TaxID=1805483 RepID=A0A177ECZ3_9MICR|nr:hypothetical protein NEDG_00729 [Nematocida displodere]